MLKASRRRRRDLVNIVEGAKIDWKCACGVDIVGSRLCVCVWSLDIPFLSHGRDTACIYAEDETLLTLIVPTSHCTYLSLCLLGLCSAEQQCFEVMKKRHCAD